MRFLHLSDLHIHKKRVDNEQVQTLLRVIAAKYPKHYLIVTGDITDDGHSEQYHNAYDLLAPFTDRIFICPGNHDYGPAGNIYNVERAALFDTELMHPLKQGADFAGEGTPIVNVIQDGEDSVAVIALDSNLETESPFDFACGEIGSHQLHALEGLFRADSRYLNAKRRILILHHHPFMRRNPFMLLRDAEAFWRTIYGRVDVVCFGHKHAGEAWRWLNGIKWVMAAPALAEDWWRTYEIDIEGDRCDIRPASLRPVTT